ncbi:hypothetical protein VU04_06395 [Desulfobulbus sp. TB]|nr:hypothetical protein [Desulfobulbus sp. TB]
MTLRNHIPTALPHQIKALPSSSPTGRAATTVPGMAAKIFWAAVSLAVLSQGSLRLGVVVVLLAHGSCALSDVLCAAVAVEGAVT